LFWLAVLRRLSIPGVSSNGIAVSIFSRAVYRSFNTNACAIHFCFIKWKIIENYITSNIGVDYSRFTSLASYRIHTAYNRTITNTFIYSLNENTSFKQANFAMQQCCIGFSILFAI
jgi:hypothetical protein